MLYDTLSSEVTYSKIFVQYCNTVASKIDPPGPTARDVAIISSAEVIRNVIPWRLSMNVGGLSCLERADGKECVNTDGDSVVWDACETVFRCARSKIRQGWLISRGEAVQSGKGWRVTKGGASARARYLN